MVIKRSRERERECVCVCVGGGWREVLPATSFKLTQKHGSSREDQTAVTAKPATAMLTDIRMSSERGC
jgi:hypothetical protein